MFSYHLHQYICHARRLLYITGETTLNGPHQVPLISWEKQDL